MSQSNTNGRLQIPFTFWVKRYEETGVYLGGFTFNLGLKGIRRFGFNYDGSQAQVLDTNGRVLAFWWSLSDIDLLEPKKQALAFTFETIKKAGINSYSELLAEATAKLRARRGKELGNASYETADQIESKPDEKIIVTPEHLPQFKALMDWL